MACKADRSGLLSPLVALGIAAAAFIAPGPAHAQGRLDALGSPGPQALVTGMPGPPRPRARSPEIHPDRTVTLRLAAPEAREVRLTGQIIGDRAHWLSAQKFLPMTRDEAGVWSLTLGPLAPDLYEYGFMADGVAALDPQNLSGQLEVPGPTPAFYDTRPVPHGTVRLEIYESRIYGVPRYVWIYTPPGYERDQRRYPVLYLLHGGNCCESIWVQTNRANVILDNLIAEGKAKPMIIVMPLGARFGPTDGLGPNPAHLAGATPPGGGPLGPQSNYAAGNFFEQDLLTGLIPFVDQRFRTLSDSDNRALSGLSQGGIQTFVIGLRHTDVFKWLAPMSGGAENMGDDQFMEPLRDVFESPDPLKRNLKLLYITSGREDVLHEADKRVADRLRARGVKLTFVSLPGRHQYSVWRKALYDVAQLLFR